MQIKVDHMGQSQFETFSFELLPNAKHTFFGMGRSATLAYLSARNQFRIFFEADQKTLPVKVQGIKQTDRVPYPLLKVGVQVFVRISIL